MQIPMLTSNTSPAWLLAAVLAFLPQPSPAVEGLPDFTSLVEKNAPAVVNISTSQKPAAKRNGRAPRFDIPDLDDGPFGEMFRKFFEQMPEFEGGDSRSLGSGFILSSDGYVMTNAHVVKDADEVVVRMTDRRELKARIVGMDERSDTALLKVEASGLPVVRIGKSSDLKVGEWVLAIGTPFGFDHSVTAGIVSAKGRSLPSENYVPFIQTDVAINPGNSGGPLFNLKGEVVGVNSQIYSRTGGYMGLSFAIPIEVAQDVADQLRTKGAVTRGWLGVLIQDVTRELAETFGMKKPAGALVAKVLPDSPAGKAGIKVGDVITEYNGQEITASSSLPPMVGRTPVGTQAPVKVLREGKELGLSIKIAELPPDEKAQLAQGGGSREPAVAGNKLGIGVAALTPEQRKKTGVEEGGVVVTTVKDGPARDAGIRQGDILQVLGQTVIRDPAHFRELVQGLAAGQSVAVLVHRGGSPLFLALRTAKE
jgi:serine protease Do